MVCHQCKDPAIGICKFCGRAVCPKHHHNMPIILAAFLGRDNTPKTIVVADALWCGVCKPQPEPIPMPEIF